jgi:hypothetical protein
VEIPLAGISTIAIADGREKASLALRNGDRLKGVVRLKPIELRTDFGRVSVRIEHVRVIRVRRLLDSLVLHYTFDKDADTVRDASGRGHHGTRHGTTWLREGRKGGACRFDGKDDHIALGTKSPLRQSAAITYSCWVMLAEGGGGHLAGAGAKGGHGFGGVVVAPRRVAFVWTPSLPGSDTHMAAALPAPLRAGEWHHVAVSIDFANCRGMICVDGNPLETSLSRTVRNGTPAGRYNTGEADTVGGRAVNASSHRFRGDLDEFMVFNRALSVTELRQLHALARSPQEQTGEDGLRRRSRFRPRKD